jgi:hypothetical protein
MVAKITAKPSAFETDKNGRKSEKKKKRVSLHIKKPIMVRFLMPTKIAIVNHQVRPVGLLQVLQRNKCRSEC